MTPAALPHAIGAAALLALAGGSLLVGASELSLAALLGGSDRALELLVESRLPRTLAVLLAGAGMAVAGLLMQMIARNRFVEPSTSGAADSAALGMLAATLWAPGMPVFARMLLAAGFALAGSGLFVAILSRIPLRSPLIPPLVGIMLGGVIHSVAAFLAYRHDLMQSLSAWMTGDFSVVLQGRYELLWIALALLALAYAAADRFTVMGLGEDLTTSLGLSHRKVTAGGLVIVSLITAAVVATCGMIPFLGLVAPNVVSLWAGDNVRRSLPLVAMLGAGLALACDLAGRLAAHPFEVPLGAVMGVVGSAMFLWLLLRSRHAG